MVLSTDGLPCALCCDGCLALYCACRDKALDCCVSNILCMYSNPDKVSVSTTYILTDGIYCTMYVGMLCTKYGLARDKVASWSDLRSSPIFECCCTAPSTATAQPRLPGIVVIHSRFPRTQYNRLLSAVDPGPSSSIHTYRPTALPHDALPQLSMSARH